MAIAAALAAGGCGGGQSGGAEVTSQAHTGKSGNAVFTYFGNPKPLTATSSGSVSVLSQAGATFSSVTLEPPPSLSDTYLVVSRGVGPQGELYKASYTSIGSAQLLYDGQTLIETPTISAYGIVGFTAVVSDAYALNSIREDGTGLASINFTGLTGLTTGTYSVDGTNRLAFYTSQGLYVGPGTGGTATLVQSYVNLSGQAFWNPTGTKLAYSGSAGSGGYYDIFTTPTSGGTPTDVTPLNFKNNGLLYPCGWSTDGVTLLARYYPSTAGTSEFITFSINNPSYYQVITPSGDNDSYACFSPDGSKIAIVRTNANGATPGTYLCDVDGLNQNLVQPDPTGDIQDLGISWSPFLPKETVVAASASTFYHQAASGFLISQNGSQFGSVVAFTAATPSSAAVQSPTNTSYENAPLIFTLTADSITSVGYINNYFGTGTTVTLTSTPTVVVSVDGSTGQVDLVAPAATAKPAVSKNADGTVTYSGQFKAIYDGHGKNLAPSGSSSLVLNPKTGALVSFR